MPAYELDVRPMLKAGDEPFGTIMEAVARLEPGQSLKLLAPFKPVPLFGVLGARGFEPHAREIGNGDWEVLFSPVGSHRKSRKQRSPTPASNGRSRASNSTIAISTRRSRWSGYSKPSRTLAPGETIAALLPREPLFLFEELKARGHDWRGGFAADGSFRIVIRAVRERRQT